MRITLKVFRPPESVFCSAGFEWVILLFFLGQDYELFQEHQYWMQLSIITTWSVTVRKFQCPLHNDVSSTLFFLVMCQVLFFFFGQLSSTLLKRFLCILLGLLQTTVPLLGQRVPLYPPRTDHMYWTKMQLKSFGLYGLLKLCALDQKKNSVLNTNELVISQKLHTKKKSVIDPKQNQWN